MFVTTNICRDQIYFVATNIILSRQKFCRGKHTFVTTNTCLSPQKLYVWQGTTANATPTPHAYRKMKLAPSPACNCGLENQTAKHYILQRCPLLQAAQTKCMTDSSPAINIQLYMRQQRGTEKDSYIHLADWTFSVATICSRQQDKKKLTCRQQQSSYKHIQLYGSKDRRNRKQTALSILQTGLLA